MGDRVSADFDAVLVVPGGAAGQAMLSASLAGMPAITRQLRLLARSGAQRLVIAYGSDADREALTTAMSNRWCPGNVEVSLQQWSGGDATLPGALSVNQLVLPAHHLLDHRCFAAPHTYLSSDDKALIWFGSADHARPAIQELLAGKAPHWPTADGKRLPDGWLASQGAPAAAEKLLWDSCRKQIDGIISAHINRPISLAISRQIVSLPVSPNQVTVFSAAVGLAGAACVMAGSYGMILLGAIMLQLASILDGVDGELARVRVQFSLLGEWLDTSADDVVNIAFVLAVGFSRWHSGMTGGWTVLAFVTAAAMVVVAVNYYIWIARAGRGDILSVDWFDPATGPANDWRGRLQTVGTTLFRRDMMIALILVAAIFNAVHLALVPIAIGEVSILAAQAARLAKRT